MALVDAAELNGFKNQNFFYSLLSRIKVKLPTCEIEYDKKQVKNEIELLKRVSDRKIIILIDDLDATFQNTTKEKKELSTFFTACRYLVQDVKDLSFRITLRTDVWPMIKRFDESLDKIEQYIIDLHWNIEDFRKLLVTRINYQISKLKKFYRKKGNQTLEQFHEFIISQIFVNKMEWGEVPSYTYKVIYTLSYTRPRWAIQLCKLAQKIALNESADKINRKHIDIVWGQYGYKRISDLVAEHKHQCTDVEELITAFRESDRRMSKEELFELIKNKILTHVHVVIEDQKINSPMKIAQFLYRIGFIVARTDNSIDGEYNHYYYSDLPDLLSNRTSNDFHVLWEIHPCYRQALDIKKLNKIQRIKRGYMKKDY